VNQTEGQVQPILCIVGEKVALGPLRRELLPLYQRWLNDFEVTRTTGRGGQPVTFEAEQAWYEQIGRTDADVVFTVYERATMRPIGNTGLHQIDHRHRTAEFGIVIGERDCWSKGYGTEVTRLLLRYGFQALDLHNIVLRVHSDNEGGIRAYTRAGFKLVGRRRQAHRRDGRAYDVIYMDCLATEFDSRSG